MAWCDHRQAEPVVLITGETVACVCVECLVPLPATFIDRQRSWAELEAYGEDIPSEFLAEFLAAMVITPEAAARLVPIQIHFPDR